LIEWSPPNVQFAKGLAARNAQDVKLLATVVENAKRKIGPNINRPVEKKLQKQPLSPNLLQLRLI